MKVGVIVATDDPARLFAAATYAATEAARGSQVILFVTGRAVLAFAGKAGGAGPEAERAAGAHWADILDAARPLGLRVLACETAGRLYGVSQGDYGGRVDGVTSMYSFLEEVGDGRVVAF